MEQLIPVPDIKASLVFTLFIVRNIVTIFSYPVSKRVNFPMSGAQIGGEKWSRNIMNRVGDKKHNFNSSIIKVEKDNLHMNSFNIMDMERRDGNVNPLIIRQQQPSLVSYESRATASSNKQFKASSIDLYKSKRANDKVASKTVNNYVGVNKHVRMKAVPTTPSETGLILVQMNTTPGLDNDNYYHENIITSHGQHYTTIPEHDEGGSYRNMEALHHSEEKEEEEFQEGKLTITKAILGSKYLKKGTALVVIAVAVVVFLLAGLTAAGVHLSPILFPIILMPIALLAFILFIPSIILFVPIVAAGLAGGKEIRKREDDDLQYSFGGEDANEIQTNLELLLKKISSRDK